MMRGDAYSFQNTRNPVTGLTEERDTVLRGVGTAGLTYAYPFVAHTATASHVVEPTVQVVSRHANDVDQRLLPNEDAKSIVFDDTLLFDVSKTSGFDRIDTGTRLNAGLQYTFQTNSGFAAKAVFGQSFHLGGENVFADPGRDVTSTAAAGVFPSAFDPLSGLQNKRSDYVAGLYLSPRQNLSLVAQGRFDENSWELNRFDTLLSFGIGPLSAQTIYTFRQYNALFDVSGNGKDQQEVQLSLGLKLDDYWSLLGTVRYDLDDKAMRQDAIGVRYADECFILTSTYTETFVENPGLGIKPDRTVMLRFELKHLGGFNYKTDVANFLTRGDNQPSN
jgi:LPS-assembly protein